MTLDEAVEAVAHPLEGRPRPVLVEAIAYLSAQVVGAQHSRDANALLAVQQIGAICRDYERKRR